MPTEKSKTLISFTNGAYKEVPVSEWRHSVWIHFRLPDGSKLAVNPANVNYLHIVKEVLTEETVAPFVRTLEPPAVAPFVRTSDCPMHDTRCTNECCILDPQHPRYRTRLK